MTTSFGFFNNRLHLFFPATSVRSSTGIELWRVAMLWTYEIQKVVGRDDREIEKWSDQDSSYRGKEDW